jgi:hypothetical protein
MLGVVIRFKRAFKKCGINLSKLNHKFQLVPLKDVISPKYAILEVPDWLGKVGTFPKRYKQVKMHVLKA